MKAKHQAPLCQESVFDQVYRTELQPLYRFVYYKSGLSDVAEDITQEAFVKLWENCSKVEQDKARAFLFTVARNIFINTVNRKKVVLRFESEQIKASGPDTPAFLLEQQEFQERLEKAISELTDEQREVFLMNRIDGLKYREIAELLGIGQKAVEKRMHKALLRLRELHKRI
jgi:RNA polymerase sigma-70 factor (ECF subfamily)